MSSALINSIMHMFTNKSHLTAQSRLELIENKALNHFSEFLQKYMSAYLNNAFKTVNSSKLQF